MKQSSFLFVLPLLTLIAGCDSPKASNSAKLSAIRQNQLKARNKAAAKLAQVEKSVECVANATMPDTPKGQVAEGKAVTIRLSGQDLRIQVEVFKNDRSSVLVLSNQGKLQLLIVDQTSKKVMASARTLVSARSLAVSQFLNGFGVLASCQEVGAPKIDPAFDRSADPWACSSTLISDDATAKQVPFAAEGAASKATGGDGTQAELTADSQKGSLYTLRLRKSGDKEPSSEASADDSAGFLFFEGSLPDGKLHARVDCIRKSTKRGL